MVMNIKDLRTDSALGARINDGSTKYAQSGNSLQSKSCKPFQDIGSNSLGKVDVQTSRPCAIIGPDRVLPTPNCNDGYVRKTSSESWHGPESIYHQPPDYPQKMSEYQPTRNISPRQTFQENMQRIMVSPYSSLKKSDDPHFHVDRNISMLKNVKLNMPPEAKYCEVPYTINPMCNEPKNVRIAEIPGSNVNPVATRNATHGWMSNNINIHPLKPYGASELHQYPDYSSCAGPRPMPMIRPHRTIHEDPGRMHGDQFFQDANVRFKPYPPTKGRYPHSRYDYVNNYSNSFHPPPPFPNHTFDPQKTVNTHSYPFYPQVPLKYIDRRMGEPIIDRYQRAGPQTNLNVAYRNPLIHPSYGSLQTNCMQNNMIPYPSENPSKSLIVNKLPYCNNNKVYLDYEPSQHKKNHISETVYSSNINHTNSLKGDVIGPNYSSVNMHGMPQYPLYRKDNGQIKNYEYVPHFRNLDPSVNFHNTLLRHPINFSPNAIAISPSDSNTSNDTTQTHTTQDDCGYVSQSSTTSGRSLDLHINGLKNEQHIYKSPEYRYGYVPKNIATQIPNSNKSSKPKKDLDVRQFLQMWNEGDDDANEQNKDEHVPKDTSNLNSLPSQYEGANKPEQLYVLGLVNVPNEELDKYNHIQKISKLPENIKGYNNIELLNQFEEAIEMSNMRMFNTKSPRELQQTRNTVPKIQKNVSPRPVSPLDVEAKISQSVIHKEVGCNFEIKPCSPKMLNVEIATPIQNILEERIIEKVSNPVVSNPHKHQKVQGSKFERSHLSNLQNTHCENLSKDDTVETNCNLDNMQYTNVNSVNSMKPNYSLQDLEYNSSVCLASLPRLDNDIELNFPEINQQFINANAIERGITSPSIKDLPILNSDQIDSTNISENKSALICDVERITPNPENDKEVTKLSKYRKLKRTDVDQKESQSVTSTKIQLRTDSVIIKNPDTIKNHEITINSPSNSPINNIQNLDNEENIINNESLTKVFSGVVEFNTRSTINENEKKHDSIEGENLDMPIDTALDFSLNKNYTELVKLSPFKENNGNDSLVNFIEEDLIPKPQDKSELLIFSNARHEFKQSLTFNDGNVNSQISDNDQEFLKSHVIDSVSEIYPDEITKNDRESDVSLSQKGLFFNTDDTNESNTSILCTVSDNMKMENSFPPVATMNTLGNTNHSSGKVSLTLSVKENLKIFKKDETVNTNNQVFENCVTNVDNSNTKTSYPEISDETRNKLLEDKFISSEEAPLVDDIKYVNNYNNENSEFTFMQGVSQNLDENNSTLIEAQISVNDNDEIDTNVIKSSVKNHDMSLRPKKFNFRKRLHSRVIQYLVLLSDSSNYLTKSKSLNNESINMGHSKHVSLGMREENIDNIKLETILSEPLKIVTNEILNINNNVNNVINADKTLISKNHGINDELSLSNDKRDGNDEQIIQSKGNDFPVHETVPDQEDFGQNDSLLKCNEENNLRPFLLSNKSRSNYNDIKNNECEFKNEKGKEISRKIEPLHNNTRAYLKRSFSDSALNIHCNDENNLFFSKNINTIPKKRKKINPCEMMEPNQMTENIIQTNRRKSISTLYDEENVSFCILIDNSYVLSEETVESQNICLAAITEDEFEEEFGNDCTFTTENVIFTDNVPSNATSPERDDLNVKLNIPEVELENDSANNYSVDQTTENKTFDEETWIEDVACIETVLSDDIVEDVVINPSSSPNAFNVLDNYSDCKNDSLIYNDNEHIEKIKYIYGDEMCVNDAELVETLYWTPQMDVKRTLVDRESHYSDDNSKCYDNDALEKLLCESNDKNDILSDTQCYNEKEDVSYLNTLKPLKEQTLNNYVKSVSPSERTDNFKNEYPKSDSYENLCKSTDNIAYDPIQYDLDYSCESTLNYVDSCNYQNVSPKYSSSSSPEVSSTTSEERSCGILLKITKCNGSISSQINEFGRKGASKNDHSLPENKELLNNFNSLSRTRPLITKAAQKYIPPLKENIHDLKVKLPLPQHSLTKLKILKISKDNPKSDKSLNKTNSFNSCYPKKAKPKFEDVLKSIDEIQIKKHKEKNKKHKQSIPKVVIKKNENGAHYTSTSDNLDDFNPDMTGRKWQPWVFMEKNCFVDKMALGNKMKAIFNHRKNTYVLAEKFRKYKSVNNASFVITKPKLEDSSSGKLKYTIRLKHNY